MHKLIFRWRPALAALAMAVAALVSGCASVTYSSPGALEGITIKGSPGRIGQLVFVDTTGYYFLWTVPLACGDIRWNEHKKSIEGGTLFFNDLVGLDEVQNVLVKIAESRNCDLVDVAFHDSDTSYAGASYGGMIGALFGSSRISASAVLVPRAEKKIPTVRKGGKK